MHKSEGQSSFYAIAISSICELKIVGVRFPSQLTVCFIVPCLCPVSFIAFYLNFIIVNQFKNIFVRINALVINDLLDAGVSLNICIHEYIDVSG